MKKADTPTAASLRQTIEVNRVPLPWTEGFAIEHARLHNLKDVSVIIPKGVLTAISGVAGSGKSTLVYQEFISRYPEAVVVNRHPIGTSSRSTPATYAGVMDENRKLFAKENGVSAQWFSANSKGPAQSARARSCRMWRLRTRWPFCAKSAAAAVITQRRCGTQTTAKISKKS